MRPPCDGRASALHGGNPTVREGAIARNLVSKAARQRIDDLEDQLTQAIADRESADNAFLVKAQLVVNGVLADPTEGPNSALYEAFGYTRKSERKSGLSRKGKQPPTK